MLDQNKKIIDYIKDGKIKEAIKCLKDLSSFNRNLRLLLVEYKLKVNEHKFNLGLITSEKHSAELQKIVLTLLSIINSKGNNLFYHLDKAKLAEIKIKNQKNISLVPHTKLDPKLRISIELTTDEGTVWLYKKSSESKIYAHYLNVVIKITNLYKHNVIVDGIKLFYQLGFMPNYDNGINWSQSNMYHGGAETVYQSFLPPPPDLTNLKPVSILKQGRGPFEEYIDCDDNWAGKEISKYINEVNRRKYYFNIPSNCTELISIKICPPENVFSDATLVYLDTFYMIHYAILGQNKSCRVNSPFGIICYSNDQLFENKTIKYWMNDELSPFKDIPVFHTWGNDRGEEE